ncbi:IS200/IS605 family transposase [Brasilonema bromeliae]|uniref:IS200/IS605 family transposase n=1 Tax=Brasilonema bromeliae TaxID=383615 RepID=UPI001FE7F813|nr:IS200/IS605 family transposase [Brasilonema bromeliae]
MRKGAHVVFDIHLHIVFVTKYRRKVLTQSMIEDIKEIFGRVLENSNSLLEECNGEADHVHLLISLHPDNNISDLVVSLKSASSRILREKYRSEIDKFYWGKAKLWHDSKCIVSCGVLYLRARCTSSNRVVSVRQFRAYFYRIFL